MKTRSKSPGICPRARRPRALLSAVVLACLAARAAAGVAETPDRLDPLERAAVIAAVARTVGTHYVDRQLAKRMADALAAEDAPDQDAEALARRLTRELRQMSGDRELEVIYSADPIPQQRSPTAADQTRYREMLKREHCLLEAEMMRAGIGYLKLDGFGDRAACQPAVEGAMAELNRARALIVDLRSNRGGMPEMVAFLAAYFFDHPEYWFNPREAATARSWTASPVAGNLLADKPLWVLTSARTISGGEQFCYNLKALRRATLVGETTAGQAHAGVFHRIDAHFGVAIPEVRSLNPYGPADWEGVGVAPDVQVRAEDALDAALRLAERQGRGR